MSDPISLKDLAAKHLVGLDLGIKPSAPVHTIKPGPIYYHTINAPSAPLSFSDSQIKSMFTVQSINAFQRKMSKPKEQTMFIYILKQRGPIGWDQNEEFVVAAKNARQARRAVADGFVNGMSGDEGVGTWLNTKKSRITRVGFYRPSHRPKAYYAGQPVILSRSFKAG